MKSATIMHFCAAFHPRWPMRFFFGSACSIAQQRAMDQVKLVDDIYEAAVVPSLWPNVLDRLAQIAGAEGGMIFTQIDGKIQLLSSPPVEELAQAWTSNGWPELNERGRRLIPLREPRFLTDLDAFSYEELEEIPFYRDLLRPMGFGWCTCTAIHSPNSDTIVFTIERLFKKGPVELQAVTALTSLRPHLARAAVLSARAGLERARTAVLALESIALPAAIIRRSGRVIAANSLFGAYEPAIMIGRNDLLAFERTDTQLLYSRALKNPLGATIANSFPVPANEVNRPAVAHLLPLRGAGLDIFTGASFLFYITALDTHSAVPEGILQALFDLTPAEARVAHLIGKGLIVSQIAQATGVQASTVRTQLKSIFGKTGIRRQAELYDLAKIRGHGQLDRQT